MSKKTLPGELQALMGTNPALKRLARAARQHDAPPGDPRETALATLPAALRERVSLVEEENRWLAMVETSASAQMLRFHLPRLERALPAKTVKILVTGRRGAATPRATPAGPILDRDSARHIREAAASIDDEALQAALKRLASRGEPPR